MILLGSKGTVLWNPGDDDYYDRNAGKSLTLLQDSKFGADDYYVQVEHGHPRHVPAKNINWQTTKPPGWH